MPPSIAFLHPDLGIGGAERLIVDCAIALKQCGYNVKIFTSHHDPDHCFEETKNDLSVITAGDSIPRSIFGRFYALCAYIRMLFLTIYFLWNHQNQYDLVICDQISVGLPLLSFYRKKSLFYCHFPDQLLTKRKSFLKKLYRLPIDWWEEWTIGYADLILVNSKFTQKIFYQTFKSLSHVNTKVLYPSVPFTTFDRKITENIPQGIHLPSTVKTIFLSINRFERKKNLSLAIRSLKILFDKYPGEIPTIHLIMAGGYDLNNVENLQHYQELATMVTELQMERYVTFLRNLSDDEKNTLLHHCTAVVYTPENEHFGIVPLEAMYMYRPVIAVNSGGPTETIIDGETGFLCQPEPESFSNAMYRFVRDKSLSREMGQKGHDIVVKKFNFEQFKQQLNKITMDLINKNNS